MSSESIQLVNVVSANNSSSGSSPEPTTATYSTFTSTASTNMSTETFYSSSYQRNSQYGLRSYNRWAPAKQGATLVWRDVCVYATTTNRTSSNRNSNLKRIINNSTGAIQPGTLMAVMGGRSVIFQ